MLDIRNVGNIIVILINYAHNKDIEQFIKYSFPKITKFDIAKSGAKTFKEFFIYHLCLSQYSCYDYICEENITNIKETFKKSKLEYIMQHLLAIYESFAEKYLYLTAGIKDFLDFEKMEKYNEKLQLKKGFKAALKDRQITDDEISLLLHIIIDTYAKYHFYYINCGDKIKKLEIVPNMEKYREPDTKPVRANKRYITVETDYEIIQHERYTTLLNTKTNEKIKVKAILTPFYTNSNGESDIKIVKLKDIEKMNSAIIKEISKK